MKALLSTNKNIFMIGATGVGKSTIGFMLSKEINFKHIDIDSLIERKCNKTISSIFSEQGEGEFRKIESAILEETAKKENKIVISTGGGCILNPHNTETMKQTGIVFYLKISVEEQLKRIQNDRKNIRPLLKGRDVLSILQSMALSRNHIYESSADYIVDTEGMTPLEVVNFSIKLILS